MECHGTWWHLVWHWQSSMEFHGTLVSFEMSPSKFHEIPNGEGVSPKDLTYCSHKPECIVTTNPDRSVLITIITWHFQFRPVNVSILHLKYDYRARSESRFVCYSHCYVTWYPLTTGVVASQCPSGKGRCARDALPHAYHIGVFKFVFTISTAIKHIYKESANLIEGCDVACDTNDCWNFQ